jgi:hypothetical protein
MKTPKMKTEQDWITANQEGKGDPARVALSRKQRKQIYFAEGYFGHDTYPPQPEQPEHTTETYKPEKDLTHDTEADSIATYSASDTSNTIPELNPAGSSFYITEIPPSILPEQDNSCPPAKELILRIRFSDTQSDSSTAYSSARLAKEADMPTLAKEMYRNAIRLSVNEGNVDRAREIAKEAGLEDILNPKDEEQDSQR